MSTRQQVAAARLDVGVFAELVGWPLTLWQLATLRLTHRVTVLVSPRQCGKSRSLAILATWWAFRAPRQTVLIVSAGDEAAGRVLRLVQQIAAHDLLHTSVVDETQHRVILSNGSEIRSVPASERQVRGWSVDLLVVDEAAFVSDELLLAAALPTTAARPDARVVLASSPWGSSGAFHSLAQAGLDGSDPAVVTFRWRLADATWIAPHVVEAARRVMSPLRFAAEFEGQFVAAGDEYFPPDDLRACVAAVPLRRDGAGMPASCGLDWGRQQDAHAVALVGVCDDGGRNRRPVLVVPWVETSRRPYGAQVAEVEALTRMWSLTVRSETNGVGAYPSEELGRRLGGLVRVTPSASTQTSKENAYGRLAVALAERSIVLPDHPELLRQLGGVVAEPTPSGGLRIGARGAGHDDLPDALTLAVAGLPRELASPPVCDVDGEWVFTPDGVGVPLPVRTVPAEPDWGTVYAGTSTEANPWAAVYR